MCSLLDTHRRPDIIFRPNGRIDITAKVATLLSLKPGDAINVWKEEDEYYLYVARRSADSNSRAICRQVNKGSNFLRVWSTPLASAIIKLSGKKEAHLTVGESVNLPMFGKAIHLITRNNLYQP